MGKRRIIHKKYWESRGEYVAANCGRNVHRDNASDDWQKVTCKICKKTRGGKG